jgi:tetratricopeptide (TPR) repeat protein
MSDTNSKLLAHLESGSYQTAIEMYQSLESPTPEDQCWAGLCLAYLGRTLEACEYLGTAWTKGFETAAVVLASVYMFSGERERAREIVTQIDSSKLGLVGTALTERVGGALAHHDGYLKLAIRHLERAWDVAIQEPNARAFLPGIAQLSGYVLSEAGFDRKALIFFTKALESCAPDRRSELLSARAFAYINAGDFLEASADLEEAKNLLLTDSYRPFYRYFCAALERARGDNERATEYFLEAIDLARQTGSQEVEVLASLELCAIATRSGALSMARAHLNRARAVASPDNSRLQAVISLRHGALLTLADHESTPAALEIAVKTFEHVGMTRDYGVACIHFTEYYLRQGNVQKANDYLSLATDARHSVASGANIAIELLALPLTLEHLATLPKKHYGYALLEDYRKLASFGVDVIRIESLGAYRLSFNGADIKLEAGLAKTIETLTYLLESGPSQVEAIQANVFEDSNETAANGYFHLIRTDVRRRTEGKLMIAFDKPSRNYSVVVEGAKLEWDLNVVRQSLEQGSETGLRQAFAAYTGAFLPNTSTEWADNLRLDFEWDVARAGLVVLQDLAKRGFFERCERLARRLLEINPMDTSTALMLLQCVHELHGVLRTQQEFEYLKAKFVQHIGVVPELLGQYANTLHAGLN